MLNDKIDFEDTVKYYFGWLLSLCMELFEYDNLPQNFNITEMERTLIINGFCGVFYPKIDNKIEPLNVSICACSGVTPFYYNFKNMIISNPIWDTFNGNIDKDCVLCRNTKLNLSLKNMLNRYAIMLADSDITTSNNIILMRVNNILVGTGETYSNEKTLEKFFNKIRFGNFSALSNKNLIDNVNTLPFGNSGDDIIKCITAKQNILRSFYREIGVSMSKEKTQAILSDETQSDTQSLAVNIIPMYNQRKENVKKINDLFATNITVKINPKYNVLDFFVDEEVEELEEVKETEIEDDSL